MPLIKKFLYICVSTLIIIYSCIEIQKPFFPIDLYPQLYSTQSLIIHYLSCLLISLISSIFFRNISIFIILQMTLIGALYIANLYKIIHLLFPVHPTDVHTILPLIIILPTNTKLILLGAFIIILILIGIASSRKLINYIYGTSLIIILGLGLHYYAKEILDYSEQHWFNDDSSRARGCLIHGPVLYLTLETLKKNNEPIIYSQIDVQQAISTLFNGDIGSNKLKTRNIYLIVVESLIDPTSMKTVQFSTDPFDSRFRKLWQQSNNSVSLSPVFGGNTSQAEFEILCGYPLLEKQIIFYKSINNNNLCLPQILSNIGYYTNAMHPFKRGYWNRNYAYKKLGIKEFLDIDKFSNNDLNGSFVSDDSFLSEAADYIQKNSVTKPRFNYLLTSASHYPYVLNDNHPKHLHISSSQPKDDDLINFENYANSIFYTTKAVMDFVNKVKASDPNSIIVIVGDHPPSLDNDFNQLFVNNYTVPLIVIDGKNGALKLGTKSHFEIPKIIMQLLGVKNNVYNYKLTQNTVRPLPMLDTVVLPTLNTICYKNSQEPLCQNITNQLSSLKTIYNDNLFGEQFSQTLISKNDGGWTRN